MNSSIIRVSFHAWQHLVSYRGEVENLALQCTRAHNVEVLDSGRSGQISRIIDSIRESRIHVLRQRHSCADSPANTDRIISVGIVDRYDLHLNFIW